MKTSLTKLEGLKRSLTVELPVEAFNQKTDKIIQKLSQTVRIDGFRKGKVPAAVLRQRFSASAMSDAATEIVSET
jgi:trigger factor